MRFGKLALGLALGLLSAGVAAAQPPGGLGFGFGFGGGGLAGMLGQNKQLQDELKLSKDQVEKVTEALAKVREDMSDEMAKLRSRDTAQEERTAIVKKLGEANAKAVDAVLKPEQLKRLHQIENQQAGLNLFTKEDVQKTLKLSDDQKEKIDTLVKDYQKDVRALFQGGRGFDQETTKKRQDLEKETRENVLKVLTADQKTALKDVTGEPFELARGGFGFGGAGGLPGFGRSQPGQVLSAPLQETLKLTAEQKKQVEDLQKEVETKLEKILTDEQKKQLKEIRERGPGGPPRRQ
jgi:Spy/CpxP family protein refolding chaperone